MFTMIRAFWWLHNIENFDTLYMGFSISYRIPVNNKNIVMEYCASMNVVTRIVLQGNLYNKSEGLHMYYLSTPYTKMESYYDVIVIGSGYGASIAASRLARADRKVCVLERGREFQPGDYPDSLVSAAKEMQINFPVGDSAKELGCETGLFDFRINDDMNVFQGCGLGGTSLVNANVSLPPDERVYEKIEWPQEIRDDIDTRLKDGFNAAIDMLKPEKYPEQHKDLDKITAMQKCASETGNDCAKIPINVSFYDGENHVGVEQVGCNNCGDCISGCNVGAKNTLIMNYLPDAVNHGAQIFTKVEVQYVKKDGDKWQVYYQIKDAERGLFDAPLQFVSASIVWLGAGSLGSTEILLRSKKKGLSTSEFVGEYFTGNGDVLAFSYNGVESLNGIGYGNSRPEDRNDTGPCITSAIDLRDPESPLEEGMIVEEGSLPGALALAIPTIMKTSKTLGKSTNTEQGFLGKMRQQFREWVTSARGPYHGATKNTQTYLVMSHDDGAGSMALEGDNLRINWPKVGQQAVFQRIDKKLHSLSVPLRGHFVRNLMWAKWLGHGLITVHPLGGCVMGQTASNGVVNHAGQVFSSNSGDDVHEGLYVGDGAIIPTPLGVNPLLTISALAERNVRILIDKNKWKLDYDTYIPDEQIGTERKLGIQFTEKMSGHVSAQAAGGSFEDYQQAEQKGKDDDQPCEFTLTIRSDDLDLMLNDESHQASAAGSVLVPMLSSKAMSVSNGKFHLFVQDPDSHNIRQMQYALNLTAEDGQQYYFYGFKMVRNDAGIDMIKDVITLYTSIYNGTDDTGTLAARGIIHIKIDDFMRQLRSIKVLNARNHKQRIDALARFTKYFSGTMAEVYGGVFNAPNYFDPNAVGRQHRVLDVSVPEVYEIKTEDNTTIRLTRYKGGKKGPVILSHGLGVSSVIFSIDTIRTNLLEYLFANEFDVWLLDYRSSILLPSSEEQHDADVIATQDYPAAVNKVRMITGAESVQMVVHCFGSTVFFMAMLAGMEGVRSAVSSQIATDIVVPSITRIKAGLHIPAFLKFIGIDSLTAYVDKNSDWKEKLFDKALKFQPTQREERCHNPVCHRIQFMYGTLYEHSQLNLATHKAMHEMFGVANIKAMDHLATMINAGHLVDYNGNEVYMPHLDRLAIPILFIQGAENKCYYPAGTEKTYDSLVSVNGEDLYQRKVVENYGHLDCIFGKNAVDDIYPMILEHLEKTALV